MEQISRVTRSKQDAKSSYDKLSKWYDTLAGRSERKFIAVALNKLSAKEGETVLEIGFGTGHGISALAQSVGDPGKVYGADISKRMCDIARSRIEELGMLHRVILTCGDAAKLPFRENLFDAIFMGFTLELFDTPEIPSVLNECLRVFKSGGRICVVSMSEKGKQTVMKKLYEWVHRKFPRYVDCRPIFVQMVLEKAGFQIIGSNQSSMWALPVETVVAKKP